MRIIKVILYRVDGHHNLIYINSIPTVNC